MEIIAGVLPSQEETNEIDCVIFAYFPYFVIFPVFPISERSITPC